jgi:hypothetical protein
MENWKTVDGRSALTGRSHRTRFRCEVMMHTWIDNAVETIARPVDELLLVSLGQSSGSRAPEPEGRYPLTDAQELWDYLGDFA